MWEAATRTICGVRRWSEREYRAIISSWKADEAIRRCLFVVEAESGVLGFAVGSVFVAETRGEIESVVVAASAQRRGVGRALCAAVADWCREQGAGRVELEVRAGSVGAIALYVGLGFVVSGRRLAYYAVPKDDAVLMVLEPGEGGRG